MTSTMRWIVPLLLLSTLPAADDEASGLARHVGFLASPELGGRMTGTPGADRAAEYLAAELGRLGARPLEGQPGFSLSFEFTAGMSDDGSTIELSVADREPVTWKQTDQIQALSFSDSAAATGEVVFAGYGLSLPDNQEFAYDSYAGLDVVGKIVLVLRYFPEDVDPETRGILSRYAGLRYKAMHARDQGASAILIVTGPRSPNAGKTAPMTFDTALAGSGIVAASIGGEVAAAIFDQVEGRSLEQLQESLDTGNPHVAGFAIPGVTLSLNSRVKREPRVAHNVVGYLPANPGKGAPSADSYIVLGAHYDHLGRGEGGNSLAGKDEAGGIHHGADDNASGVAAVLAAGERLRGGPRNHPVLLAFWAGEELGLLGSSKFVDGDLLASDRIMAYLNFDMVGRMRDNRLSLQSVGSSPVWPGLIERTNVGLGFDVNPQDDPYLPTDASSFYRIGVPTLSFFTGAHEDYHKPSDTADRINYEDLDRVALFAANLSMKLDGLDARPDYVEVQRNVEDTGGREGVRAYTGTIPDYTTEVQGLRLSGVIGGGPADQAGIKEGDIVVEFAGQKIANIYDYTYALEAVKIGQANKIVVLRDGERIELEITPTSRK